MTDGEMPVKLPKVFSADATEKAEEAYVKLSPAGLGKPQELVRVFPDEPRTCGRTLFNRSVISIR